MPTKASVNVSATALILGVMMHLYSISLCWNKDKRFWQYFKEIANNHFVEILSQV